MLRVVFDTVIFVRALINPYGLWGRLVFQNRGRYELVISPPTVRELLDVIHRPEVARRFRTLANLDVRQVLELIEQARVVTFDDVPQIARDAKDDVFLATAAAARADYLVSEDNDLLVLGVHGNVKIVTAADFLDLLDRDEG